MVALQPVYREPERPPFNGRHLLKVVVWAIDDCKIMNTWPYTKHIDDIFTFSLTLQFHLHGMKNLVISDFQLRSSTTRKRLGRRAPEVSLGFARGHLAATGQPHWRKNGQDNTDFRHEIWICFPWKRAGHDDNDAQSVWCIYVCIYVCIYIYMYMYKFMYIPLYVRCRNFRNRWSAACTKLKYILRSFNRLQNGCVSSYDWLICALFRCEARSCESICSHLQLRKMKISQQLWATWGCHMWLPIGSVCMVSKC